MSKRITICVCVILLGCVRVVSAGENNKDLGSIWFVGDSITQGNGDNDLTSSVRKELYELLTAAGYTFTYTGHRNKSSDGLPADPQAYHFHSGCSGIQIAGSSKGLKFWWDKGVLKNRKPDIVLIMLGTNDVNRNKDLENAPARLKALIEQMYALPTFGNPKVFLASIPPNRIDDRRREDVVTFNKSVPEIVKECKKNGKDIFFVDQYTPLNNAYKETMRSDNLHPNGAGNKTMAKQWFDAIQKAF